MIPPCNLKEGLPAKSRQPLFLSASVHVENPKGPSKLWYTANSRPAFWRGVPRHSAGPVLLAADETMACIAPRHHEKPAGLGCPKGLAGGRLVFLERVVAISISNIVSALGSARLQAGLCQGQGPPRFRKRAKPGAIGSKGRPPHKDGSRRGHGECGPLLSAGRENLPADCRRIPVPAQAFLPYADV